MIDTVKNRFNQIIVILAFILIGLNLRPSMAALGPLLPAIKDDLFLNYTQISLLTMLPILAMGIAMFSSNYFMTRFSAKSLVVWSLVVIGISNFIRLFSLNTEYNLFISAITAGCGIAIIQAIIPSIIKRKFPNYVSLYIGLYVTSIMAGAAITAALAPIIEKYTGNWMLSLSVWGVLAILAILAWLNVDIIADTSDTKVSKVSKVSINLYKIPRAWALGVFFGLGTASYTCVLAWLPPYYLELGKSSSESGFLLAFLTGCEVIAGLLFPAWANNKNDLRPIFTIIILCNIIGYIGLIFLPNIYTLVWMMFLGLGIGGLFPMSLILTVQHYKDAAQAGQLATFVQGVGYIIAAFSPFISGILRDTTNSFSMSWSILLVLTTFLLLFVYRFNPNTYIIRMQKKI